MRTELKTERNLYSTTNELVSIQNELEVSKKDLESAKAEYLQFLESSETHRKAVLYGIEGEHELEINYIRTSNQLQLKDQEKIYREKLENLQEKFSATLKQVNEFTASKADDKERFYETRIADLIKEYSQHEAVLLSNIRELKAEIVNSDYTQRQLTEELDSFDSLIKNIENTGKSL